MVEQQPSKLWDASSSLAEWVFLFLYKIECMAFFVGKR